MPVINPGPCTEQRINASLRPSKQTVSEAPEGPAPTAVVTFTAILVPLSLLPCLAPSSFPLRQLVQKWGAPESRYPTISVASDNKVLTMFIDFLSVFF